MPSGGSSPIGTIGYVNAAFELKDQIDKKIIPEPDLIYIPLGENIFFYLKKIINSKKNQKNLL